jgi:RNA polymerase sigma factor (sigma-70 family)
MTGSISDGEDVVQETLARAYYILAEQETLPPLRPWLFRIAHTRAIDYLRRYERRMSDPIDELVNAIPDEKPDPAEALAQEEAMHAAITRFMALVPLQRSCVVLKDVLDHSLDEIAALLDISVPAVKAALHRGRVRLQELATANTQIAAAMALRTRATPRASANAAVKAQTATAAATNAAAHENAPAAETNATTHQNSTAAATNATTHQNSTAAATNATTHQNSTAAATNATTHQNSTAAPSAAIARFAALFNARDWDGVRSMLAEDVRLDLVSRIQLTGRAVQKYMTNYDKYPDWRFVPAWLDGHEIIAVFRPSQNPKPAYFIELTFANDQVKSIRDFLYVPYIAREADITWS